MQLTWKSSKVAFFISYTSITWFKSWFKLIFLCSKMLGAVSVNGLCPTNFRPLLRRPVADGLLTFSSSSVALNGRGSRFGISSNLSVKDCFEQSKEMIKINDDGGPPRWFSPLESGSRLKDSPLLLFLPGPSLTVPISPSPSTTL